MSEKKFLTCPHGEILQAKNCNCHRGVPLTQNDFKILYVVPHTKSYPNPSTNPDIFDDDVTGRHQSYMELHSENSL